MVEAVMFRFGGVRYPLKRNLGLIVGLLTSSALDFLLEARSLPVGETK